MSRGSKSASDSAPKSTPLRPEEQGYPVLEAYEGFRNGCRVATVSLTLDRQTWIAGVEDQDEEAHIGSFPSLDEAQSAVGRRLSAESAAVTWIRRAIPGGPAL